MNEALRDARGLVAVIAMVGGIAGAIVAMATGNNEQVEAFLAVSGGAGLFIGGLASEPFSGE